MAELIFNVDVGLGGNVLLRMSCGHLTDSLNLTLLLHEKGKKRIKICGRPGR